MWLCGDVVIKALVYVCGESISVCGESIGVFVCWKNIGDLSLPVFSYLYFLAISILSLSFSVCVCVRYFCLNDNGYLFSVSLIHYLHVFYSLSLLTPAD